MKKEMHIIGGFKTWQGASVAAQRLEEAGVPRQSIGILLAQEARNKLGVVEKHTRAAEGASVGGIAGGALGGLVAGLTAVATVAVPGIGLLAAGPIVAALAGAGLGAAAGGTVGGLVGLGMTEMELKHYTELLKTDGVLVSVTTTDKSVREQCREVLKEAGALAIESDSGRRARVEATSDGRREQL